LSEIHAMVQLHPFPYPPTTLPLGAGMWSRVDNVNQICQILIKSLQGLSCSERPSQKWPSSVASSPLQRCKRYTARHCDHSKKSNWITL